MLNRYISNASLGTLIDIIAQGDLRGKLIGVSVGIGVIIFSLWLMRRVEKSYAKVFEAMLALLLLNWPYALVVNRAVLSVTWAVFACYL